MLTNDDKRILHFEQRWVGQAGKEAAIVREFGWRQARYYQRLNSILDDPAALAEETQLVYRLRGRRERLEAARRGALIGRDG